MAPDVGGCARGPGSEVAAPLTEEVALRVHDVAEHVGAGPAFTRAGGASVGRSVDHGGEAGSCVQGAGVWGVMGTDWRASLGGS